MFHPKFHSISSDDITFRPSSWLVSVYFPALGAPTIVTLRDLAFSGWWGSFGIKETDDLRAEYINTQTKLVKRIGYNIINIHGDKIQRLFSPCYLLNSSPEASRGAGDALTAVWWNRDDDRDPHQKNKTALPFCNLSRKAPEDTKLAGVQWKRHFLTVCGPKTEQPVNKQRTNNR